jgi:hypothetical protein
MGLFKKLFSGGEESLKEKEYNRDDDIFSPRYKTIRKWIESRIGKIDTKDPNLIPRMKKLHEEEFCRFKEPVDNLDIYYESGDTVLMGNTRKYEKQIRKLGFCWDRKRGAWISYDRELNKEDLLARCKNRTVGLESYIKKVEYRVKLEGK